MTNVYITEAGLYFDSFRWRECCERNEKRGAGCAWPGLPFFATGIQTEVLFRLSVEFLPHKNAPTNGCLQKLHKIMNKLSFGARGSDFR